MTVPRRMEVIAPIAWLAECESSEEDLYETRDNHNPALAGIRIKKAPLDIMYEICGRREQIVVRGGDDLSENVPRRIAPSSAGRACLAVRAMISRGR